MLLIPISLLFFIDFLYSVFLVKNFVCLHLPLSLHFVPHLFQMEFEHILVSIFLGEVDSLAESNNVLWVTANVIPFTHRTLLSER